MLVTHRLILTCCIIEWLFFKDIMFFCFCDFILPFKRKKRKLWLKIEVRWRRLLKMNWKEINPLLGFVANSTRISKRQSITDTGMCTPTPCDWGKITFFFFFFTFNQHFVKCQQTYYVFFFRFWQCWLLLSHFHFSKYERVDIYFHAKYFSIL